MISEIEGLQQGFQVKTREVQKKLNANGVIAATQF